MKTNPADLKVYLKYHYLNFTDENKNVKCCPNPKCELSVQTTNYLREEVKCNCGTLFCFKCNQASHKPCTCEMQKKWELKNQDESENVTWIMANTKPCPNCSKPIEKNQGCHHMHCISCNFHFCWTCMKGEKGHVPGQYWVCLKKPEVDAKEVDKVQQAQNDL